MGSRVVHVPELGRDRRVPFCTRPLVLVKSDMRSRKQARRTGMAGPLGEMFDHGCDAINTSVSPILPASNKYLLTAIQKLECILAAYALNLGRSWWTVASQVASLAAFYLTTWEEFHTGQLFLGVFSGPVEGILMIVAIFAISGTYGTWLNIIDMREM